VIHARANEERTKKLADEKGVAPPYTYESGFGGIIDRAGDILLGNVEQKLGPDRVNVKVMREIARQHFAGHKVGDQVTYTWFSDDGDLQVTYTLSPAGKWVIEPPPWPWMVPLSAEQRLRVLENANRALDINWLLSPDVSDRSVFCRIFGPEVA
jgi:hypothetical protein